ncbi:retrovirus-related pol polyprotein from transposon TNT 1-94 [Tanacetum coccineum]
MESPGYGVLVFESSWFLVKCRHRYAVIYLEDTAVKDGQNISSMSSFKLQNGCLLANLHQVPKTIEGPPVCLPDVKKSVSFQKSILGPGPKYIMICLGVDLEPDEWIKDRGCSKHMTGNRKLFSTYKEYNGGQICNNKCKVTFSEHDSEITKDGKIIGRGIRKKGLILGHTNMRLIQSLASKELIRNLPNLKFDQHFCDACKISKQAHASHKAKNKVSTTRCLELLHMDLFSSSAIRSYGGNLYTLVIVDYYSRTDHGREFDNEVQFREFCNANSITHNLSAPRTPQSNGVVENKNRTLQEMSRTMLNEHSLP